MERDFRREAYKTLIDAALGCEATDTASLLWDISVPMGKELKAMHTRSRNFELMLTRIVRLVKTKRCGGGGEQREEYESKLEELTDKAADLLSRLGGEGVLR